MIGSLLLDFGGWLAHVGSLQYEHGIPPISRNLYQWIIIVSPMISKIFHMVNDIKL